MTLRRQDKFHSNALVRKITDPTQRAFLGGIVLAAPFIVPTAGLRAAMLMLPFLLVLVLHLAINGIQKSNLRQTPAIVVLVAAIAAIHLVGLNIGGTAHAAIVIGNVLVAGALIAAFVVAPNPAGQRHEMSAGFFAILVPFSVAVAAFALVKAALLERGFLLNFLWTHAVQYPAGTSLRSDYNLFGMTMLVAAIGLLLQLCKRAAAGKGLLWPLVGLLLVGTAAMLAGSRRTLIVGMLVIPMYWLVLTRIVFLKHHVLSKTIFALIAVCTGIACLAWIIQSPRPVETYTVLDLKFVQAKWVGIPPAPESRPQEPSARATPQVIESGRPPEVPPSYQEPTAVTSDSAPRALASEEVRVTNPSPVSILSTIQLQYALGFDSRIERWLLAIKMIGEQGWRGMGFSYHEIFACKFVNCGDLDYPHMPVMSEWLIGGAIGGFAGIAFFALIIIAAWKAGHRGWRSGATPAVITVLPFALISGDTVLSAPQLLAVGLLAHSIRRCIRSRK